MEHDLNDVKTHLNFSKNMIDDDLKQIDDLKGNLDINKIQKIAGKISND